VNTIPTHKTAFASPRRASGFTLIEVLVAVLVLSIGLLGLASLQATSLRFNTDSSAQTLATYLANDMADRMRANVNQAPNYPNQGAQADPTCYSGGCSPTQMAGNDIAEWTNALVQNLPAGQGTITAAGGGVYTIRVMWDERRDGAVGTNCDPNDPNDLRCISITTQP
jgi:type IV pilus assembly protein PilV